MMFKKKKPEPTPTMAVLYAKDGFEHLYRLAFNDDDRRVAVADAADLGYQTWCLPYEIFLKRSRPLTWVPKHVKEHGNPDSVLQMPARGGNLDWLRTMSVQRNPKKIEAA